MGTSQFLAHRVPDTCNHHTKDSSPISSRRELNQFHAHHVSNHQAHPRPLLDLVLHAPNTTPHAYTSYTEDKATQSHTQAHTNMEFRINSLKLGTLAQAKPTASLRLVHLTWASLRQ